MIMYIDYYSRYWLLATREGGFIPNGHVRLTASIRQQAGQPVRPGIENALRPRFRSLPPHAGRTTVIKKIRLGGDRSASEAG